MATRGDFIRAVIRARRKAVEFMNANPDEAGDIVAKPYNIEPGGRAQRRAQPDHQHDRRAFPIGATARSTSRA